ncbi:APC amino acid permease [Mycena polygramma]|nr:APC amino acid permease [Mycena polygramma]
MTSVHSSVDDDDKELLALGYVPSFKREFSQSRHALQRRLNTPLTLGGPSTVVWCWILGACMCFTLGSAFPTCGGLYTASAQLTPRKVPRIVGWVVGWLNILGMSVLPRGFGLSGMILAAGRRFEPVQGKVVGLFAGLLVLNGFFNSLATRHLARFTQYFVFINLGATALIIITLLATTPRAEMHPAGTTTRRAHISEEVKRAAYAAPAAIFIAVALLPGPSGSAMLQIMTLRMGKTGALHILWVFVCLTAFFVVQTACRLVSRTVFAFSRDHGLPDGGYFGYNSPSRTPPLRAIWFSTIFSILPGLLDLASPAAANAIFSLTAIALDLSYIIPIALRRVFQNHPEVMFKPGPFYMGAGLLGWSANIACISWTLFVCVIFSFPTVKPVITVGVMFLSLVWYFLHAHKHYRGPTSNISEQTAGSGSQLSVHDDSELTAGEKGSRELKGDMA